MFFLKQNLKLKQHNIYSNQFSTVQKCLSDRPNAVNFEDDKFHSLDIGLSGQVHFPTNEITDKQLIKIPRL